MNENRAREMAQAIIEKVREEIRNQTARVRTGVVPNLDRLTKAIQTYTAARYLTHPEVWPKGRYTYDYTQVVVDWVDEEWWVLVHRAYTRVDLPLVQKVIPLPGSDHLRRRDGGIELVKKGIYLQRDPASGVYLAGDYRPPEEILRAAATGPFQVELYQTVINIHPAGFPAVLRHKDPGERIELRYKQHKARINLGRGELLAHLAMWRLTE